jgi:SAM-dependent methyltransferase
VGSGHGGFVALLRCIGFEAVGLELGPWLVEFSQKAFDVPILQGPIEDQEIEPGSLDFIALMDVLEHLPDPVATMRRCDSLLKPDGAVFIQTPRFPDPTTHADLKANNDLFLKMLIGDEHTFLFSVSSIRMLFGRLGYVHVDVQPALAPHDMFVVVGRTTLRKHAPDETDRALAQTSGGRLVQAMLDLHRRAEELQEAMAQKDRCIASLRSTLAAENRWLACLHSAFGLDGRSWSKSARKAAGRLRRMIAKRRS